MPAWDLLDEDFSDISDWADEDNGSAVSEVSPAGQLHATTGATLGSDAKRTRDVGSIPNTITVELKLYCDTLNGSAVTGDRAYLDIRQAGQVFIAYWSTDGMMVYNGGSRVEAGTDLVKYGGSAEWQVWRLLINFSTHKVDIYLTDSTHSRSLVGNQLSWSLTGTYTDGVVYVQLSTGAGTSGMEAHWDYIKMASGLYVPAIPRVMLWS